MFTPLKAILHVSRMHIFMRASQWERLPEEGDGESMWRYEEKRDDQIDKERWISTNSLLEYSAH